MRIWKKIKSRPLWWLAAVLLLLCVLWAIGRIWWAQPDAPALITAAVQRGDIEDAVLASGTIQAAKLINAGSQASGQVKKLYVGLGEQVKKGQLIAEIDATTQQNELQEAQATLASARAQKTARQGALVQAQQNFDRQKYMFERDAASRADYQSALQALVAARADLASAQSSVTQYRVRMQTAQANLGYTRITAPMDGTVVAIVTDAGQTVNAMQSAPTIVKLAQLQTMTIQAQISEADVSRVKPGTHAYFTTLGEPDRRHEALLRSVEPGPIDMKSYEGNASSSSNNAVYYNGLLDAPNPKGDLRIGMTAQVTLVLQRAQNALLIPSGALGQRGQGAQRNTYSVRVLTADAKGPRLQERQVCIGLNNRVQAQVLCGLKEGEQVVVGDASADKASGRKRPAGLF